MDPTLVTGGTGTLGRHVVRRLRDSGRDVRVFTRRPRKDEDGIRFVTGDLLSGTEVDLAVDGVATIIHCAGSNKGDEVATLNLVNAAARTGRPHLVYISVVGAERMPVTGLLDRTMFSYFDMKLKAEQVVAGSGLPWTTVRATQFHDLILMVLEKLAKLPVVPVPSGVSSSSRWGSRRDSFPTSQVRACTERRIWSADTWKRPTIGGFCCRSGCRGRPLVHYAPVLTWLPSAP